MSIEIRGEEIVIQELERRLGPARTRQIVDNALKKGAEVFVRELKKEVRTFSDGKGYSKGYTYDEITVSEPMTIDGVRTIKIYWKGPHNRYRIIHLNEWGTVKNPNPRGKGAIARAMRNAKEKYRETVKRAIQEGI